MIPRSAVVVVDEIFQTTLLEADPIDGLESKACPTMRPR